MSAKITQVKILSLVRKPMPQSTVVIIDKKTKNRNKRNKKIDYDEKEY